MLEVLVSILLLSLLSLVSWRALDGLQRGSERVDAVVDDTRAMARVLGQLEDELTHLATAQSEPEPVRGAPMAVIQGLPAGLHIDQADASRTVLSIVRASPAGAWQRIVWRWEGSGLTRTAGLAAATLPLPMPADGTQVMGGVSGFSLRLWVPGRGWVAPQSGDAAEGEAKASATGLEITLKRPLRGGEAVFRKVVVLQ